MGGKIKIGIVICDRYRGCAGGKCFRSMRNREGAFRIYNTEDELEIVGFTSCGGCPGGNVEYAPGEMLKNGAQVIHFATGLVVGYPPCPHITYFKKFIEKNYGLEVIIGTHPIPQKYLEAHKKLGTWDEPEWDEITAATMDDEKVRLAYN